jgi:two-component system sensor histidine kinase VicK
MDPVEQLQQNLTESLLREKDLKSRVDELEDFIENAALPLHWVNGSGIIIWANKMELELLGYTREEYIGKHISKFHHDMDTSEDILFRLINKETLDNYPAMLKAKNGMTIPVLINSNARWEGDKFIHTRCFTRDISDLKKLEAEKATLVNQLNEKVRNLTAENTLLKGQS